jgi:hypothetical protein
LKHFLKCQQENRLKNEQWLITNDKKEAVCKVCNKVITGGITHIKRHADSEYHKRKVDCAKKTTKMSMYVSTQNTKEKLKLAVKK